MTLWLKTHALLKLCRNDEALSTNNRAEEIADFVSWRTKIKNQRLFKVETFYWKGVVLHH